MANTKKKTNTGNKKGTKSSTSTTAKKKTTTVSASKQTAAKKTTTTKKKTTTTAKKTTPKKTAAKTTTTKKVAPKATSTKKATTKKTQAPKKKVTAKKIDNFEELESLKEERVIKTSSSDEKRNKIFTIVAVSVLVLAIILSCVVSNKDAKYNKNANTNQTNNSTSGTTGTGGVSEESASIKDEERKELNTIGIDDYLTLLAGEEPAIVYIARPTCSHCENQKPIMENLVYKYDVKINYLNTDELDSDGMVKLQSSDDFFNEGWGTPTTLIVKGGKIIDAIAGETSGQSLVELFKKYGIINE